MTEYITKGQAYNSVDERINELRNDDEFNIVKQICVSGVKKHIKGILAADVVEREKYEQLNEEANALSKAYQEEHEKYKQLRLNVAKAIEEMKVEIYCDNGFSQGVRRAMEILERNIGE